MKIEKFSPFQGNDWSSTGGGTHQTKTTFSGYYVWSVSNINLIG